MHWHTGCHYQQDYEDCVAKLNYVLGRKLFLLHFQTFVNARQRLPKEPLEVLRLEVTQLGQDYSRSASHHAPHAKFSKHKYDAPGELRGERGKDIAALRLCLLTVVATPLLPTIRDPAGHTVIIPTPDTPLVTASHRLLHLLHIGVTIILPAIRITSGTTAQGGATLLTISTQDTQTKMTPTDT